MGNFVFIELAIKGVYLIKTRKYEDSRGYFLETFNYDEFKSNGIDFVIRQSNTSRSSKGVFRGMHIQLENTQAKVVRVSKGKVISFALDLRYGSDTYGKHIYELIDEISGNMLYIPRGFAHGFICLEDNTEFSYICDDVYNPKCESGIKYDDPDIGIKDILDKYMKEYDIDKLILSGKDQILPNLEDFKKNVGGKKFC